VDWSRLLNEERLKPDRYPEPKEWGKYNISEFEKDYKKVVANSGFRRFQDKTQVFPLDKSDFVRTRLTHSMGCHLFPLISNLMELLNPSSSTTI